MKPIFTTERCKWIEINVMTNYWSIGVLLNHSTGRAWDLAIAKIFALMLWRVFVRISLKVFSQFEIKVHHLWLKPVQITMRLYLMCLNPPDEVNLSQFLTVLREEGTQRDWQVCHTMSHCFQILLSSTLLSISKYQKNKSFAVTQPPTVQNLFARLTTARNRAICVRGVCG